MHRKRKYNLVGDRLSVECVKFALDGLCFYVLGFYVKCRGLDTNVS